MFILVKHKIHDMKLNNLLFVIALFSGILNCLAQQKFEREYRIDTTEVPQNAKTFIKECNFKKKIKWYAEESQDGKTYEAKTIKDKYKLSIEFDLDGNILDVEKTIVFTEIELETRNRIKTTLLDRFKKFKIKKIQIQWTGESAELINYINNNLNYEASLFEIVLKSKTEKAFYEVLINRKGEILKELSFAPRYLDNLEY